jgi:transposase
VLPVGAPQIEAHVPEILEAGEQELPVLLRQVIRQLYEHLQYLAQQGKQCEALIQSWHRQSEASQRLAAIPGVGLLTATALVATVGDARQYRTARQFAASLGLVPRQHSSGGKFKALIRDAYDDARFGASDETGLPVSSFPEICPYLLEQILDLEFLPDA